MSFFRNLKRSIQARRMPVNPVMGSIRPVSKFQDDFNRMRLPRNEPLGIERLMPNNMMAAPSLPMPQTIPTERFPMIRPGFAKGEEVSSGMRSGSTGPRVQNLTPGKGMIGTKAGLGSGKFRLPSPGTITAAARGAAMSPISKFGIPGAIAAGGIALYQIADETGMVPEEIGRGAASVQKAFTEVVNEAVDMARDIGAPIQDFVERVKMGYQQEMSAGMPDEPDPMRFEPVADPRDMLGEQGRTISNRDLEMLSRGQLRDILGETGRTISNLDRQMAGDYLAPPQQVRPPRNPMMGEVPMFAEGLAVDIENLEKKN